LDTALWEHPGNITEIVPAENMECGVRRQAKRDAALEAGVGLNQQSAVAASLYRRTP
jgi:hypothetical protein